MRKRMSDTERFAAIAKVVRDPNLTAEQKLQRIAELLPADFTKAPQEPTHG